MLLFEHKKDLKNKENVWKIMCFFLDNQAWKHILVQPTNKIKTL